MDSAVNKLQIALASASNEVTIAAANLNFDFSLVKCEAPIEFHPLSGHLTQKRKHEAEAGKTHVTARRLGALFENVCPATPNLEKAYGRRVSQIAETASNEQSTNYSRSIFGAYLGVDGTSIWAAVTASKAALHVHLLACMLARVFDAPEAISIWFELVQERRRDIAIQLEKGDAMPFHLASAAAQQEIPRSQLAEWDGSARAWLQTADSVKQWHHTQMSLVLKNVNLSIGTGNALFSNVLTAWNTALDTMEKLISGMPQAVNDGSALLGLSAWHLYPDGIFFGSKPVEIHMKDELIIKGGILSLGLKASSDSDELPSGVWWSLSLAHLRHYGRPVQSQVHLGSDVTRLSWFHFQITVLGVLLGHWNIPVDQTGAALRSLQLLVNGLQKLSKKRRIDGWMMVVSDACSAYFQESSLGNELVDKLLNLGRRRCTSFIVSNELGNRPFFDLLYIHVLVETMRGTNERIKFLRYLTEVKADLRDEIALIRYTDKKKTFSFFDDLDMDFEGDKADVGTSAPFHVETQSFHEDHEGDSVASDISLENSTGELPTSQKPCYASAVPLPVSGPLESHRRVAVPSDVPVCHYRWLTDPTDPLCSESKGEILHSNEIFEDDKATFVVEGKIFKFEFGDLETAGVFMPPPIKKARTSPSITCNDLLWCIQNDLLDESQVERLVRGSPYFRPLLLLSVVSRLYCALPGATINVKALDRPIVDTTCGRKLFTYVSDQANPYSTPSKGRQIEVRAIYLSEAFAFIAYLDGGHDVDVAHFIGVIAISVGNSLYVPKQLISDPGTPCRDYELRRILGNIGKPGLVLLSTPQQELLVRERSPSNWMLESTMPFDGRSEDLFGGTSLHLSCTNYHVPVFLNSSSGLQDSSVSVLETVVSVQDSGNWVGDAAILHASKSQYVHTYIQRPCEHMSDAALQGSTITSVGSWDDVLNCPSGIVVIKSYGNWVARLSLICLLLQTQLVNGRRIVLCGAQVCYHCVTELGHQSAIYIQ